MIRKSILSLSSNSSINNYKHVALRHRILTSGISSIPSGIGYCDCVNFSVCYTYSNTFCCISLLLNTVNISADAANSDCTPACFYAHPYSGLHKPRCALCTQLHKAPPLPRTWVGRPIWAGRQNLAPRLHAGGGYKLHARGRKSWGGVVGHTYRVPVHLGT